MKKLFCSLIFLILSSPVAFGIEDIKKVYLNEAIEAALKNNIDLQAEQININIAKNDIKKANRLQNPSFDAFYFLGAAGRSEPKQLGASQLIEIAKRSARKDLAKSNLELVQKSDSKEFLQFLEHYLYTYFYHYQKS